MTLHHTDPPCAACAENERRLLTWRGRLGSLLVDIGMWLGGTYKNDPMRRG